MRVQLLLVGLLFCLGPPSGAGAVPKRYAFVVGNGSYAALPGIPTAIDEARLIKKELEDAGFDVTLVQDAKMPELQTADEAKFLRKVQPGDVVFFYYSGYIVSGPEDDDYLLPVDFKPGSDITENTFRLVRLLQDLSDRKTALKFVMIEGPRRVPVGSVGVGLTSPDIRDYGETLFAMSVQPGEELKPSSQMGFFTQAVVEFMQETGLQSDELFEQAKRKVLGTTNQQQQPFFNSTIVTTFYFHEPPPTPDPPPPPPPPLRANQRDREEYVFVPPGKFKMGCAPADTKCAPEEKPQHEVTISKGFYLGRNEVTVAAYQRFVASAKEAKKPLRMPAAPLYNRGWKTTDYPMVLVSWEQAQEFCRWAGGRLPTEAEMEYAARGGAMDEVYPGNDENSRDKANFYGTHGNDLYEDAAPVRSFDPNGFNLFDMSGNVWEWAQDWYSSTFYQTSPTVDPQGPAMGKDHIIRGGSFESDFRQDLRLSVRKPQGGSSYKVGFRCALPYDDSTKKLFNIQ
jgi:formylglycine-generating enzyme required for sulfatase activity